MLKIRQESQIFPFLPLDKVSMNPSSMGELGLLPFERVVLSDGRTSFVGVSFPDLQVERGCAFVHSTLFEAMGKGEVKISVNKLDLGQNKKCTRITLSPSSPFDSEDNMLYKWKDWVSRKMRGSMVCL